MDLDINDRAPETKAGISSEAYATQDEMTRIFETYKQSNDERLARMERRGSADVLDNDKVARIDAALDHHQRRLDELTLKNARPALEGTRGAGVRSLAALEHKAAFDGYVRRGESGTLRELEVKAMSVGSNPDGGYLVQCSPLPFSRLSPPSAPACRGRYGLA